MCDVIHEPAPRTPSRRTRIVVGVDGSTSSWDALLWAVGEADRQCAALDLLIVDQGEPGTSESRLTQMVTEARRLEPSVRITGQVLQGDVTTALREASCGSRMVVVGHRDRGGIGRLLARSTSRRIADESAVPVAVVRGQQWGQGPIVVGVDGSPCSEAALGVALDEAVARGCPVVAAFAYSHPTHPWMVDGGPPPSDPLLLHDSARAALESAVAPWRDKYPGVDLTTATTPTTVVPFLVELSAHAQFLVVGAHGQDLSTGPLGSVPGKLLRRAGCPVLIVRADGPGTCADRP
jgi:nucleotide-binding universal stress UspA family protein